MTQQIGSVPSRKSVACDFALTNCEQPPVRRFEIRFCKQWEIVTRCDRHRVPDGHYRQSWPLLATYVAPDEDQNAALDTRLGPWSSR